MPGNDERDWLPAREAGKGPGGQRIAEGYIGVNDQARGPDQPDRIIDALLDEFKIVAGEIASRSQAQYVLPLALGFFSSFLSAMWLDHARVITGKGTYISTNLWPRLRERLGAWELTSHEDRARRQEAGRPARLFVIPVTGVFVVPAKPQAFAAVIARPAGAGRVRPNALAGRGNGAGPGSVSCTAAPSSAAAGCCVVRSSGAMIAAAVHAAQAVSMAAVWCAWAGRSWAGAGSSAAWPDF